jgi:PAS domain S-box-containing protein
MIKILVGLLLVLSSAMSVALAIYAWRRRQAAWAQAYAAMMSMAALWSLAYIFQLYSEEIALKILCEYIVIIGAVFSCFSWLIFALLYTHHDGWATRRNVLLLLSLPTLLVFLCWRIPALYLVSFTLKPVGQFLLWDVTYGPLYWVGLIIEDGAILLGLLLIARAFVRWRQPYRSQAGILLIAIAIPLMASLFYSFNLWPPYRVDLSAFALNITGLVMAWGLFRYGMLDLIPVARDVLVDVIDDGMIVLDAHDRVVDVNLAAQRIIGRDRSQLIGQPASHALHQWSELLSQTHEAAKCQVEIVVEQDGTPRHYLVHTTPLVDRHGVRTGCMILAHDISELKQTEATLLRREVEFRMLAEHAPDIIARLDSQARVLYISPSVERVAGLAPKEIIGKNWWDLAFSSQLRACLDQDFQEALEQRGQNTIEWQLRSATGTRWMQTHIAPEFADDGPVKTVVIITREITERKRAEAAQQNAQDELMVLYRISASASQAPGSEALLTQALSEAQRALHSRAGVAFLADEAEDGKPARLQLVAQRGIPTDVLEALALGAGQGGLLDWMPKQGQPLLVLDIATDPRLSPVMRKWGGGSLLVAPLLAEGQVLGLLGLINRTGSPFSAAQVALLASIGDLVGMAVYSHRLNRLATLREERGRLARELHDSVTQSLYGLTTLTEAGQAQLGAGSPVAAAHTLVRIGETARQALKEMRLFIHQLRPSELERTGLVAALLERIAAVEGRSGVQAQLLGDEDLHLTPFRENALFQIAQEALNNTLRHARAISVRVRLARENSHVVLEITDDGCGFDLGAVSRGGMGLKNMRERAALAGGRLEIISALGVGTTVKVTLP